MTNQELQSLKNKYDIIGNDPALNRALEVAVTVAPTDITVLVSAKAVSEKRTFRESFIRAALEREESTLPSTAEPYQKVP